MHESNGVLSEYEETIRELSEMIVTAQRPIRILDALKWDQSIEEYFFSHQCKKLPHINHDYYLKTNPLSFDPKKKKAEFHEIIHIIRKRLGQYSGVGSIMQRICAEYIQVVELLEWRGKKRFTQISQNLYGSSEDAFHVGAPTLKDLATLVNSALENVTDDVKTEADIAKYTSKEVVKRLSKRLDPYFSDNEIHVVLSDGIIADASAGADKIKIRADAKFNLRDIRIFEIHEGWVHLGTTLNGMAQPICTFLGKGPPSATVTQEGLAIITELFTFSSYPGRVQTLTNRITAVNMAEDGANFFDVFQFYLERGKNELESYHATMRVFRGSTPYSGPFTKDLSYSKGFILIYNYMRLAVQRGAVSNIPLLFVGKTTLEDVHVLGDLLNEGILVPPKYVPPQFKDLSALSAWMVYSLFLNRLDLRRLALDFKGFL